MAEFWEDVVAGHLATTELGSSAHDWKALRSVASFRPTLYVGLGGFGCSVVRSLKEAVLRLIPDESIQGNFAFVGVDTHTRERVDALLDSEYAPLSIDIIPDQVASQPGNELTLGWYRELVGRWKADRVRGGARKVRAVGRLALLHTPALTDFYSKVVQGLTRITRFRELSDPGARPKVYLISSAFGGTGSGLFLDVCSIVQKTLQTNYGGNCDFHAILATPEAWQSEVSATNDLPDFYANTYAFLKELAHFIGGGEDIVHYGITGPGFDSLRVTSAHMPRLIHLVTGVNSDRRGVAQSKEDLAGIITAYLLLEIQTPLETAKGVPKVQDAENNLYGEEGNAGRLRFLSSLGVVRFGVPHEELQSLFALSLLHAAAGQELAAPGTPLVDTQAFIDELRLGEDGTDQLQDRLLSTRENRPYLLPIDLLGRVDGVNRDTLPNECEKYVLGTEEVLIRELGAQLDTNATELFASARSRMTERYQELLERTSLQAASSFVEALDQTLERHASALEKEIAASALAAKRARDRVDLGLRSVRDACGSQWFGRRNRMRDAIQALDADIDLSLKAQARLLAQQRGAGLYKSVRALCGESIDHASSAVRALRGRRTFVEARSADLALKLDRLANLEHREGGNRFSLIDAGRAREVYRAIFDAAAEAAAVDRVRRQWREENLLQSVAMTESEWFTKGGRLAEESARTRLESFDLVAALRRFYPDPASQAQLLTTLRALGSSLFPVDANVREGSYESSQVLAVHPSIRSDLEKLLEGLRDGGQAIAQAYFPTRHEVVVYSITHGYTAHSLAMCSQYAPHYDDLQDRYERARAQQRAHRPIHNRTDAASWEPLAPRDAGTEDTLRYFIVGRALQEVGPPAAAGAKPRFIQRRGSNYYCWTDDEREVLLGSGLDGALDGLSDKLDIQRMLRDRIKQDIENMGQREARALLETQYLPKLDEDIETARKSRNDPRVKLLEELKRALKRYVDEALRAGAA